MKLSRAAIALYVGLVFACGAVLGAFGHRLYMASSVSASFLPAVMAPSRPNPNAEEFRKKQMAEYQSRLKLTPDQVSKFNAIMDETQARVTDIRKQMHPEYVKVHNEQQEKVRKILTPEQLLELDKMHKEREEHQKQSGGHGPGPGI
jgi:Spy/CpxP family protein refolding chaperone